VSNNNEIVCETPEAFSRACLQYGAATEWPYLRPGQVTHGNVIAPIRIVYRPPAPKDEAREAFEKWRSGEDCVQYAFLRAEGRYVEPSHEKAYRAFLAGRASVKP